MVLIRISDKHSYLRLGLQPPIVLNLGKKYELGGHMMFSLNKAYDTENVMF